MLVLGPLSEFVSERLIIDFPLSFQRCLMTSMNSSQDTMEKGLQNNIFVHYGKRSSIYECTTIEAIRDVCSQVCIFRLFINLRYCRVRQIRLYLYKVSFQLTIYKYIVL